jgi:hypothetical protein
MKKGLKNRRAKERRVRVIQRLETQLKDKGRPSKFTGCLVPLTEQNEKRIKKELSVLKERI